ncbi:lipase [Pilimelia terevasa]|uniref:Lipase n=1 Tax=Pilimelia terevasa TaxID=53372 RepID=A0A8J3FK58_9ACTN|nr:prolyl oligopeptidase family serine peptidase [Pilimelia terevasa]GGK42865.1 lipase [Pilimelia terevasa]
MAEDSRSVLTRAAPAADLTLAYGPHADQVLDLRMPRDGRGAPVVAVLHGGFWRPQYDRAHVGPLAHDLAGRGWPVAVLEYRRTGWADTAADVAAGLAALPSLAGPPLVRAGVPAPEGVLLLGHSAGGHLALWAAVEHPAAVRGALALAPVADLAEAHRLDLDGGAVADLLGGGPAEVPDRYAAADPLRRPRPHRVTLVHGAADRQVPVAQSRRYAAAHGVPLVELAGVAHFDLIDPRAAAWPAVCAALAALADAPDRPPGAAPAGPGAAQAPVDPASLRRSR